MKRISIALWLVAASGTSLGAEPPAVTVYSESDGGAVDSRILRNSGMDADALPGYAMVQEPLEISLPEGKTEVRHTRLPVLVDPASIFLLTPEPSGVQVRSQRYRNDMVGAHQLLQRYVGAEVEVEQGRGAGALKYQGTLLSSADGLVLQTDRGAVQVVRDYDAIRIVKSDTDLVAQPTVIWTLSAKKAGKSTLRLTYETAGMTWWADYQIVLKEQGATCEAQVAARATVVNRTGLDYHGVRLHLVAGQPHRAANAKAAPRMRAAMLESADTANSTQQTLSEYHLYTLDDLVNLPQGATQQFPLLPTASKVRCTKKLVFDSRLSQPVGFLRNPIAEPGYGTGTQASVQASLELSNRKQSGLGIPVPAGRARVFQAAANDTTLQFIGEDTVPHTAADEPINIALGKSFDVVGERSQRDFRVDEQRRVMEEEIEIELRNHKGRDVQVQVVEPLSRWRQWQIVESSQEYQKLSAHAIEFTKQVPANGEATVRYRIRYSW